MSRQVTVTSIHTLPSCVDTVWLFNAVDEDGDEIVIGIDHRPATMVFDLLNIEGPFEAKVDEWQIINVGSHL